MLQTETFVDVLRCWASSRPEDSALTFLEHGESGTHHVCYKSLHLRAREIALGIAKVIGPGDHALLLHPPGLEFITAFFGCMYAGVVPVPAYPPRNARHFPRIEAIIADAGARCVLTESDFRGRLTAWLDQRDGTLPVLCTDAMHDDADGWEPIAGITGDTLAFLQYTSGSTGDPKGVMVTHGNLMANQRMIQQAFGHSTGLVQVSWLPVYHDMGLIGNLMQPLFLGGHCVFMSPVAFLQKPRRWLAAISDYRAQGSGGPNFALRLCARTIIGEQKTGLDLSSLKVFFTGSEPINSTVLEEFAAAFAENGFRREALYCCYGMAETTLLATGSTPGVGPIFETIDGDELAHNVARVDGECMNPRVVVGCGKAVPGQELVIVKPERGVPEADGEVGEIWLRGANVARGYWRKPDVTREMFAARLGSETGYLRTGDLGYLRNGELFVTGRIKDLIIIRGRNHYPQDIEDTVDSSHAALAQNACSAVPVEIRGEESLVIIVEVQRAMLRSVNPDEVFSAVRRSVFEKHELLTHAIVLIRPATLPRTSSGKVQRHECRTQFLQGKLDAVASWTDDLSRADCDARMDNVSAHEANGIGTNAAGPLFRDRARFARISSVRIEAWLQNWLAARLGLDVSHIDPEKAFADSGLDSVSGVALTSDLSQWLGFEVAATLVWDYPTIRAASKYLAQQHANAADSPNLDANGRIAQPMLNTALDLDESLQDSVELLARELASLRDADGQPTATNQGDGVERPTGRRKPRRVALSTSALEDEQL